MINPAGLDSFAGIPTPLWPSGVGILVDPRSRRPLRPDSPWSLTDGDRRWPVIDRIGYLREARDTMRAEVVARLDAGDRRAALALLLTDRDDFAPGPPIDETTAREMVDAVQGGPETLRGAMAGLGYGPVGDYLAHRESLPTFLSGLGLLMRHWPGKGVPLVDVACGIGSFLRPIIGQRQPAVGLDVVFSKLWLARHFVCPTASLVCADVVLGWPIEGRGPDEQASVFCHDALYFLPEKRKVLESFQRLAGPGGRVLIGHAHNRRFDQRGVSGSPLTPEEYEALLPGAACYDDAELARVPLGGTARATSPGELSGVEAVAMAWSGAGVPPPVGRVPDLGLPTAGCRLRLNPLLTASGEGLAIDWPTDRMRSEFGHSIGYLTDAAMPTEAMLDMARSGSGSDPGIVDLVRRRVLIDLPERW